jgi:hypothetical protein
MGAPEPCPRCGAAGAGAPRRIGPLDALYHEVARIRAIAERQETEQETIASLTREVQMLRETVARLRGTTHPAAARPQRVPSPAA